MKPILILLGVAAIIGVAVAASKDKTVSKDKEPAKDFVGGTLTSTYGPNYKNILIGQYGEEKAMQIIENARRTNRL